MGVCAVCGSSGSTQRHHISYNPEILIDVCIDCHIEIHSGGGVGSLPKSVQKQFEVSRDMDERRVENYYIYTDTEEKEFKGGFYNVSILKSRATKEALIRVRASVWLEKSTGTFYLLNDQMISKLSLIDHITSGES